MQTPLRVGLRLAVAAAATLVITAGAPAAAQDDLVGDRAITVTPAEGLTDGQTVTVEWTGFTPDSQVTVIQCADAGGLKSETCNTGVAQFNQPAGAEGSGSVDLVVHTGQTGPDGLCDADANNTCVIAANEDLKDGVTATAPITFAAEGDTPPPAPEGAGGEAPPPADPPDELADTGAETVPLTIAAVLLLALGAVAVRRSSLRRAR